jgi:predicted Zn-dependent protease
MRVDTTSYQVARARVRLHHSKNANSLLKELQSNETETQAHTSDIEIYLSAITHIALQQTTEAERLLHRLVTRAPESIAYRETLGQLYHTQGKYRQAVSLYRKGLERYPHNEMLTLSLATNLIALHEYPKGRERLQDVLRRNPRSASAFRLMAQLESEAGNQPAAHLAQAEHYLLLEEPHSALEQLKIAKRITNLDFYHAARIEALDKEITSYLERVKELSAE